SNRFSRFMDKTSISFRAELRDTLLLAGPIVLSQVGHMSMAMVDTAMAGQISTTALAALALSVNCFWTFTSICCGSLLALDTYFSQAVGAGDAKALQKYLGQSFWSCGFVAAISLLCVITGMSAYLALAPASGVRDDFAAYMHTILWCLPSLFVFFVLQRYWQARHRVLPMTIIIVAANFLNLWACMAFGLGRWGFPNLGVRGLALATVLSRYSMVLAAVVYTWWKFRPAQWRVPRLDWSLQRQFFRLGVPAASHTALEIGAFTIATFVVGALGAVPLAAHHVSLMLASFTFMFPLGFSAAAAVRVGTFVGAGQPDRARAAGWLCIGVSVAVMSCFAVAYLLFPRALLHCFTQDRAVVDIGARILLLVALFQVADGTQVCTTGALRGLGDTRSAMIANLIGHYPIGLLLGLIFCFGFGFGVTGLWVGLAVGLVSVAAILVRAWGAAARNSQARALVASPA
ncbi:MAG TPA: MATE family efflux transporter, partial [Verrucomicrobiae bacterium]|nr:MATE family efflux transporter [Verrucomicrobiae bacterium]